MIYIVLTCPNLFSLPLKQAAEAAGELTERAFFIFPREISMNAYQYIVKNGDALKGLRNSILVTTVGTAINMFFSCTLAYPLSRTYFKGRNFVTNMVIITMLFSGGMVPGYIVIANLLHLRDTYWALWLPLSKPVPASVSLFYAVGHWNSYFNAMMYISDKKKEVIQIVLRRIVFLTSSVTSDSSFERKQPERYLWPGAV